MKPTKTVLALLLSLALAFTLVLPAFAETDPPEDFDPDMMPVITVQPQSIRIRVHEAYTLSVDAYIPNGDEIGYRWRGSGITEPRPSYAPEWTKEFTKSYGQIDAGIYEYTVEVYNLNNPEYSVTSEVVQVEAYATFRDRVESYFARLLFAFSLFWGPIFLILIFPFIAPFLPLIWIKNWLF